MYQTLWGTSIYTNGVVTQRIPQIARRTDSAIPHKERISLFCSVGISLGLIPTNTAPISRLFQAFSTQGIHENPRPAMAVDAGSSFSHFHIRIQPVNGNIRAYHLALSHPQSFRLRLQYFPFLPFPKPLHVSNSGRIHLPVVQPPLSETTASIATISSDASIKPISIRRAAARCQVPCIPTRPSIIVKCVFMPL